VPRSLLGATSLAFKEGRSSNHWPSESSAWTQAETEGSGEDDEMYREGSSEVWRTLFRYLLYLRRWQPISTRRLRSCNVEFKAVRHGKCAYS